MGAVEREKRLATGDDHISAHEAAAQFDRTVPQGQAGFEDPSAGVVDTAMSELFEVLDLDANKPADQAKAK